MVVNKNKDVWRREQEPGLNQQWSESHSGGLVVDCGRKLLIYWEKRLKSTFISPYNHIHTHLKTLLISKFKTTKKELLFLFFATFSIPACEIMSLFQPTQ